VRPSEDIRHGGRDAVRLVERRNDDADLHALRGGRSPMNEAIRPAPLPSARCEWKMSGWHRVHGGGCGSGTATSRASRAPRAAAGRSRENGPRPLGGGVLRRARSLSLPPPRVRPRSSRGLLPDRGRRRAARRELPARFPRGGLDDARHQSAPSGVDGGDRARPGRFLAAPSATTRIGRQSAVRTTRRSEGRSDRSASAPAAGMSACPTCQQVVPWTCLASRRLQAAASSPRARSTASGARTGASSPSPSGGRSSRESWS